MQIVVVIHGGKTVKNIENLFVTVNDPFRAEFSLAKLQV